MYVMRNVHSLTSWSGCNVCLLLISYLPPALIFLLIVGVCLVFNLYFILLCIDNHSVVLVSICTACLIVGNGATAMLLWAFFLVVATPAGYVTSAVWQYPPRYVGDCADFKPPLPEELEANPHTVTQLDRNKRLRYCVPCGQFKPDRAHHCDVCNRCTYEFDHHCPLLNNCIGRENYKFFLLLILYAPVASFLEGGLILLNVFVTHSTEFDSLWVLACIFIFAVGISSLFFVLGHVCLLYHGESTMSWHISSLRRRSQAQQEQRDASEVRRRKHCEAVLGTDRRCWRVILPLRPTRHADLSVP